jgi:hypothetical protein
MSELIYEAWLSKQVAPVGSNSDILDIQIQRYFQ